MNGRGSRQQRGREGFVLLALIVFITIVIIVAASLFAMASYETRGALYRQVSSEAFYLADGAVERARAKFLDDRAWRDGWSGEAEGSGTYDLTVSDTTWSGYDSPVKILSTGHVEQADRLIEVIADVPPTALGLPLLVMGDAEVGGNLCLTGDAHINGDAAGGSGHGDPHFSCDGEYTEGFEITPPIVYTEPGHFPGATYYYVKGHRDGATYTARIFDADMNDITGTIDMSSLTSYNNGTKTYTFSFNSAARIAQYFDNSTGYFRPVSPATAAVVNFGELPLDPAVALYHALVFDGNSSSNIHATVINSRFTGTSDDERLDTAYWEGAKLEIKQVTFEPYYGIAMICHDLERTGSAQAHLGTTTWPALVYVTRDVVMINSNLDIVGSLICLNDFHSTGGPDITYDPGFIPNLPDYLVESWPDGVSGTLKVIRWRELAYTGS
jgi:type II secretory pathway pseudopilin PulG